MKQYTLRKSLPIMLLLLAYCALLGYLSNWLVITA
jgi:hypothetical protein